MPTFNIKKIVIIMGVVLLVAAAILIVAQALKKANVTTGPGAGNNLSAGNGVLPQAGPGGQPNVAPSGANQLQTTAGQTGTTTTAAPATAETRPNKIQDLITYTSAGQTLTNDGSSVQYYDQADNKFYKLDANNQPVALTDKQFFNVQQVTWSPDKNSAILEYNDQSKIIYNFATGQQITLPSYWQNFQFSPNGGQIVFQSIGYNPDNSWLAVVSSDGTSAKTIEKIGANAPNVIDSWSPNNQTIAMYSEGQTFDQKTVYFEGLNGENFKSMTVNGRGFQPLWSPDGSRLLYSVYSTASNMKPTLWMVEAQGDTIGNNLKPLNLQTWANKCVFISASAAYCAVPVSLPDGAGLSQAAVTDENDSLYLVNVLSGQTTIIDDSNKYNMMNLIVTTDQKSLYFTDQKSGRLYKLAL
jgi:Tol biopolymer transport system component